MVWFRIWEGDGVWYGFVFSIQNVLVCCRIFQNVLEYSKKFYGGGGGWYVAITESTQVQTS